MATDSSPHSELPEHARDWIKIPPTPERLAEIRTFADSDVLDLVEPEEMYWFLGLEEQFAFYKSGAEAQMDSDAEEIEALRQIQRGLNEQLEALQETLALTYGLLAHQMNEDLLARYDAQLPRKATLDDLFVSNPARES